MSNKYLIYLALITSGILLGVFFCNYSYFVFEKTIKITDLLSLTITSMVGIYIATNVSRAFTRNNSEKEFLINEIKSTLSILDQIISQANNKNLPFKRTLNNFKSINENLILIEKLIQSSHCNGITIEETRQAFLISRKLVTRISPTNDSIILDSSNFNISNSSLIKFKTSLYNLIFEINKK